VLYNGEEAGEQEIALERLRAGGAYIVKESGYSFTADGEESRPEGQARRQDPSPYRRGLMNPSDGKRNIDNMLKEKTKRELRNWAIAAAAAAAALALGCAISGDGPLRFVVRLFTLDYLPALETGASLVTVALFGFLTSFHCIGMCGGIIISQCAGHERGGIRQGLAYNIGRVIAAR
jgi:hypothetical protein